jgi:predicted secreted acid phosphatase
MKLKFLLIAICLLLFSNKSFSQFFFLNDSASVSNYYISGNHDAELRGIIAPAMEHFKNTTANENDVFVFDIDETSLSNFEVFRASGYKWNAELYDNQLKTESSPAIKPVLELYNVLVERGYKIFFITGRDDNEFNYKHTYGNLQKAGYAKIDSLIYVPNNMKTQPHSSIKALYAQNLLKRVIILSVTSAISGVIWPEEMPATWLESQTIFTA